MNAALSARTAHPSPPAELLVGKVMHERLRPVRHRFLYPVFWIAVDVARLNELASWWFGVDRTRLLSLRQRDFGPRDGSALEPWMRAQLLAAGCPADGVIRLYTFPRVLGYVFNPVSFWHCHDRSGSLRAVLAEVSNTFGARHGYLLVAVDGGSITAETRLVCKKILHVSPFCQIEGEYHFRFRVEAQHCFTAIDYHNADGLLIRTAIAGRRQPFSTSNVFAVLLRQPLLTFGIIARIHWQALRLWIKGVPFLGKHPSSPDKAPAALPDAEISNIPTSTSTLEKATP